MGILRKASIETVKINLDETDYIVVKKSISKKEFNALAVAMPQSAAEGKSEDINLGEATEFQRYLFGALVTDWSLPTPPSVEEYDALDVESASAVDTAVANHFESLVPDSEAKKEPLT